MTKITIISIFLFLDDTPAPRRNGRHPEVGTAPGPNLTGVQSSIRGQMRPTRKEERRQKRRQKKRQPVKIFNDSGLKLARKVGRRRLQLTIFNTACRGVEEPLLILYLLCYNNIL
jgi:hypothetical protein